MKTEDIQQEYYARTATLYDEMHWQEVEHNVALKYVLNFTQMLKVASILDVGSGTGRVVKFFLANNPLIRVTGVEPVKSLIGQAVQKNNIPGELLIYAKGERLPFGNESFDAVCAFGVLHHVKNPSVVVKEMMRVAKKAVFISDGNRFGHGNQILRLIKLLLYKLHLWNIANLVKTNGKGFTISEGDGLAYSYSVFDSFHFLSQWANKIILIPTRNEKTSSWFHPLLTSSTILLCALKEEL